MLAVVPSAVRADPAEILVHKGDPATTFDCTNAGSDWNDYPSYVETVTGTQLTFRHDNQNLFILVKMPVSVPNPADYWGIEFDNNGDKAHMGTSANPDDAIIVTAGCPDSTARDSFLKGFAYPSYDESFVGTNDASGEMTYSNGSYTIQITRPLVTGDSLGHDVQFTVAMKIGVGFVAGTFGQGAAHKGTDMSTYVLSLLNETSTGGGIVTLKQESNMGLANNMGQLMFMGTIGLLGFHFVRRRAWRFKPYESKELEAAPFATAVVARHDAGMRFSHWAHAGLMFGLLITGLSIHDKSYLLGSMTTPVHLVFAFSILVIDFPIHFAAMWRGGDMRNIFTPKKDDIKVAVGTTANFFYLSKKYPEHATWDVKANKYYLDRKYCSYQKYLLYGDIIFIIAMGVTGLALYWPENMQWMTSLLGSSTNIRAMHLFVFYYFAASVMAHMYLSFIPSNLGRMNAMITGKGKIRVHMEPEESRVVLRTPGPVAADGGSEIPGAAGEQE